MVTPVRTSAGEPRCMIIEPQIGRLREMEKLAGRPMDEVRARRAASAVDAASSHCTPADGQNPGFRPVPQGAARTGR